MPDLSLTESPATSLLCWYKALSQNQKAPLAISAKPLIRQIPTPGIPYVLECVELLDRELQLLCKDRYSRETPIRLVALVAAFNYCLAPREHHDYWKSVWTLRAEMASMVHQESASELTLEQLLADTKVAFDEEVKQTVQLVHDFAGLAQTELSPSYVRHWYFLHGEG